MTVRRTGGEDDLSMIAGGRWVTIATGETFLHAASGSGKVSRLNRRNKNNE